MKNFIIILMTMMFVHGCARIQQGDSDQVSIKHGSAVGYDKIFKQASEHCAKYGKKAVIQGRFSEMESVFECI